ncbi:hypothetical protein CANINC_002138 [Pichia inconspicua]|uniref:ATP-dependent RNA helicase n=1 Tax=Pichia inconspicua TaxID=52247 RepID=A0A4V4NFT6_9ASCO|nr:hypothetical protein CANINC_002138 [[Candida] inconspicua]
MSVALLKSFIVKDSTIKFTTTFGCRFFSQGIKDQNVETTNDATTTVNDATPTLDTQVITSNVISETNLHPALKKAFIKNVGETLTPVQEQCINEFLNSKNGIVVRAKTGTGKTFAFGIPVIHSVLSSKDSNNGQTGNFVNSVVFSPTRDLAYQTRQSLTQLYEACVDKTDKVSNRKGSYNPRSRVPRGGEELIPLVIGQTPYRATMNYFHNKVRPPIVVATPGRFMDLLEKEPKFRNSFKYLQNIIIDEADELLNGNFKEDINKIIDDLASIREPIPNVEDSNSFVKPKTMLFSATVNDDVFNLAERAISNDFPFVDVTGTKIQEVNENISQTLVYTDSLLSSYTAAVKFILDHVNDKNFKPIIFLSTTSSVDFISKLLTDVLSANNVRRRVLSFHGKLTQGKRDNAQRIFRERNNTILVASGIGARGMDFPDVSHVIQIGVSSEIDSHTHKIGRTGRAGKKGEALLFTSKLEEPFVKALRKNGNKFTETIQFDSNEPEAIDVARMIKEETSSYLDLEDTFFKTLTHYRNIPSSVAKLDLNGLAVDLAKTYNALLSKNDDEDEEAVHKISMSYNMAKNMGLDYQKIEDYYELTGRRPASNSRNGNRNNTGNRGGNRGGNHNWNQRNDRSGYRSNDRSGYRSNDRSRNDRGDDRNKGDNDRRSRW